MKLRIVAAVALVICSLYGCSGNRSATTSLYTPAPVTPRPTFDTTRYNTKEELNAKKDSNFVIASKGVDSTNSYPSKESEYTCVFEEPTAKPTSNKSNSVNTVVRPIGAYTVNTNNTTVSTYNSSSLPSVVTPAPTPVQRDADAIPSGFSSKNYPYAIYSHDGSRFLGDITMLPDNENSIWNQNGEYGSPDSTTSIFNSYGIYGSSNSMFSAFNETASSPPRIYDSKGNQVGFLTKNLTYLDGIDIDTLKDYVEENGF